MTYRVIIQPPAGVEIERAYLRIAANAPETAARWFRAQRSMTTDEIKTP